MGVAGRPHDNAVKHLSGLEFAGVKSFSPFFFSFLGILKTKSCQLKSLRI